MFFLYDLERTITLHPYYFGPHMREYLINKLLTDVEGTCTGRYYIICVLDAYNISMGKILPGSGLAEFTISYRAVVWRPFKGETVDGVVTAVSKLGFFANVGPLPVFVSTHLIPADVKFDPTANPPQFSDNEGQVIEKGAHVRLKLVGTRSDVGKMSAIGSIKEDYLGFVTRMVTAMRYMLICYNIDVCKWRDRMVFVLSLFFPQYPQLQLLTLLISLHISKGSFICMHA
ncbi:DNA-directed RNA polymerase II subunit [Orbilia oligospora]|nr:DNA-directed RNA polymerase II subunit [Orbilia oligospora]KAF3179389.1 DNA-directed RNA polymerase II subunit [Orbilia oligospora]KAF3253143.1 DNA-directed RNA polymerase II subunit [Orbilia oligospora]KAF3266997.1 DNA-directed RNA polymerase II subunit [Orbilia oligospora]KAF3280994.1 DNA-directed RNA polymerase II subunit [Orbilia oligospora]